MGNINIGHPRHISIGHHRRRTVFTTSRNSAQSMDLVFSMSVRASGADTDYGLELVQDVIGMINYENGKVQVGLAPRTLDSTRWKIDLSDHDGPVEITGAIEELRSNLENSLKFRFDYLIRTAFDQSNGDRPTAPNVAVVFIDDKTAISNEVIQQAATLRGQDVEVIVMAVNDVTIADAAKLTGTERIIHVDSYDEMSHYKKDLLEKIYDALG